MSKRTIVLTACVMLGFSALPLRAEDGAATPAVATEQAPAEAMQARQGAPQKPAARDAGAKLPADSVTRHDLTLPGRTLRYTATAGSLPLLDAKGKLLAEVAYVAYTLDGAAPEKRPITFVFNGGPGASSAYLHFGALGPKRISFGNAGDRPSSAAVLKDNPETWLDFTDLVFVDPVGTGFSRLADAGDDARKQFWSVDGDIRSLSRVVAKYLARNDRLSSPKYLVGESYGGFRLPKLASRLQTDEGIGISGMVMLSPVLDFGLLREGPSKVLTSASLLPSMAAAKLDRDGRFDAAAMPAIEAYAAGPYLADLMRGPRDAAARARMVDRVTELTGLDRALVERLGGRIDQASFAREFYRGQDKVGSGYDVLVTSPDPYPFSARTRFGDPILEGATAPLTSAAVDYLSRTLKWRPDARYHLLNEEVNRRWDWGGGIDAPEAVSDLRAALALDDRMRVLVAHGYTDLVTPYVQTKFVLDQLPRIGPDGRVQLVVYPGGHMFYSRDGSRTAFREAARSVYEQPAAASAGNGAKRD